MLFELSLSLKLIILIIYLSDKVLHQFKSGEDYLGDFFIKGLIFNDYGKIS